MLFRSQIASEVSGSIGGLTGSHNKGGLYFRRRTTPVNPNTAQQQAVRAAVASLTNAWGEVLTQLQRDAWDVYAANTLLTDPFGASRSVTGLNMYVRSNVSRSQAGVLPVDDAPTVFSVGSFTPFTAPAADTGTQQVAFAYADTDDWVDEDDSHLLVYVARPQNPTINFFKGPYRFAGKVDGAATLPPSSPALIDVPFPISAGQKVFFRGVVTRVDGRLSNTQRMDAIAV